MEHLDGNSVLRSASLTDYPPEAIDYSPGEEVLVWTSSGREGADASFEQAVVIESSQQTGRMRVKTKDCTVLEYGSGAPKRGRFTLALPNACTKRSQLQIYAINRNDLTSRDARDSWNFLLLGPGARPIGEMLVTHLRCVPDADESNITRYWLYLQGVATKEHACQMIADAAQSCLWSFLSLQALLESFQELTLTNNHDGTFVLSGPCSTALVPALKKHLGLLGNAQPCDDTKVAYSKRERVLFYGSSLTPESARGAVERGLDCACIPLRLLDAGRDELVRTLKASAAALGWRCREEGPAARYAQVVSDAEKGYSCPACILAVHGPRQEALCLLNYARFHAEVPVVRHAEIESPNQQSREAWEPRCPRDKAAVAWSTYGTDDDADNVYFGPWSLKKAPKEDDERAYRNRVLSQWSVRNMKRKLEGEMACVKPMQYDVRVDFASALDFIEYADFQTVDGVCSLPRIGWCGLINPAEWIKSSQVEIRVRITIWPQEGIAFRRAQSRPAPRARVNTKALLASGSYRHLKLARAFVSSEDHLNLPDCNGRLVTGPTPLHLCASGHPEAWSWAEMATQAVTRGHTPNPSDIEDIFSTWKRKINDADRPCSLCMTCKLVTNDAIPGFWDVRADDSIQICTFPCSWRPRRRSLCTTTVSAHQLPPRPITNAEEAPGCAAGPFFDYRKTISSKFAMESSKVDGDALAPNELDAVAYWVYVLGKLGRLQTRPKAKAGTLWPRELLQQLAVVPQNDGECEYLSATIEVLAMSNLGSDFDKKLHMVKTWLDISVLPMRIVSRELSTERGKLEFVSVLRRCGEVSNLKTACCFYFASRNLCDCVDRGWDAKALSQWIENTLISKPVPWSLSESLENLTLAIASEHPARRALSLVASDVNLTLEAWVRMWNTCDDAVHTAVVCDHAAQALASRESEQLHSPQVGSRRWFDSRDHPEHAALLLDHALRELVSALLYLWCLGSHSPSHSPLIELRDENIVGAVRGDAEYLHVESGVRKVSRASLAQLAMRLLTHHLDPCAAADLSEALTVRLENLLSEGCASTTSLTAGCLPRKSAWLVHNEAIA